VSLTILGTDGERLRCMAYEPTKGFREIVRALLPGDEILAVGSYKNESLNLEKLRADRLVADRLLRPPLCPDCGRRMTSAGRDKGYKCRECGRRTGDPDIITTPRAIRTGWYEVPPTARRHLSKPLVRDQGEA